MSEYQYYEFRTVNRTLTREEQRVVETWSSRGKVTPVSASFEYSYSDFRQNAQKCLEDYFDVMLYVANWGSKRTMFRLPAHLVNFKALKAYAWGGEYDEHSIDIRKSKDYVIIEIEENLEGGYEDWIEGEGILAGFAPLWNELVAGNYTALYLTWLHFADQNQAIDGEADMETPPIPAGVHKSSAALQSYLDFWGISNDLAAAAAQFCPEETAPSPKTWEKNIRKLPEKEKDAFLLQLLQGEPNPRETLLKRLEDVEPSPKTKTQPTPALQAILDAEKEIITQRNQREQAAAALKRRIELEDLEKRADKVWKSVYENLELKIKSGYNQAIADLKDLRDLAKMRGTLPTFDEKLREIIAQYGHYKTFAQCLNEAAFGTI